MHTKTKLLLRVAPAFAVALVLAACGGDSGGSGFGLKDTPKTASVNVGPRLNSLAPNFKLQKPDGTEVELASLRGKPVFLNFWATWCGPCKTEMPEIQRLHERAGDRIQILAVNLDETAKDIEPFFKELKLTFPTVIDKGKKVANGYRLLGVPASIVIDKDGIVQDIRFGPYADDADLAKSVAKVGIT